MAPQHLQRAAEAEQREIVGRRAVDHRLELGRRLLVALGAEESASERLADRCLIGVEIPGARERDRRLVVVPRLEELRPAPEQVVHVIHEEGSLGGALLARRGWDGAGGAGAAPTAPAACRADRTGSRADAAGPGAEPPWGPPCFPRTAPG